MTIESIDYKKLTCPGSPFQSSFWAAVKHGIGWKPYAFSLHEEAWDSSLLVLVKQLFPFCYLAYVPFGPDVFHSPTSNVSDFMKQLSRQLKKLLPKGVFAIRYDLPWDEVNDPNVMWLSSRRFRTAKESVQPDGTVRIDLKWGYEGVSLGYRDRAKRSLRKSFQLFEVVAWSGEILEYKRWYEIYLETAKKDGFAPRSSKYLKALLALDGKVNGDVNCRLFLAKQDKRIVGGIIVLFTSQEAVYLYGASLRLDNFSCSTSLQDFAIKQACQYGCKYYDLFGIPGPKGRGQHLAGLDLFKRSFGGQVYYRTPTTDYVLNFFIWKMYTISENFRYGMMRKARNQEGSSPNV